MEELFGEAPITEVFREFNEECGQWNPSRAKPAPSRSWQSRPSNNSSDRLSRCTGSIRGDVDTKAFLGTET